MHTYIHTYFRKCVTLLTFLNEISDRHGGVDRWSAVVLPGVCIIEAASTQVAVQGQGGGPRTRLLACERGDDKRALRGKIIRSIVAESVASR